MNRKELEAKYGQVWNTDQLTNDFRVESFFAPFCFVVRKADNVAGSMLFQHAPRYYYNFKRALR